MLTRKQRNWVTRVQFLIKLNMSRLYRNTVISLVGIYPREMKTYVHRGFIHNSPELETTHSVWGTNSGPSTLWNTTQQENSGPPLHKTASRDLCWVKKANPQGHILPGSIYKTFLKWRNYRHGEQMNGGRGVRGGGSYAGAAWGILVVKVMSVSWLHQCPHPDFDVGLWFCRMITSGEIGQSVHRNFLSFLTTAYKFTVSQKKKREKKMIIRKERQSGGVGRESGERELPWSP